MTVFINNSNKKGLLIGINSYPNFGPRCNLDGCINDVSVMGQLLRETFGFSNQGLTTLRDDQATQQGILDAFDSLIQRAEKDDIIVIQFSGHGSQMKADKGIKPNGYYQTIVPHDSGRNDKKNLDIVDDLIYLKMLDLTEITPFVTYIFDSCHSGTIVRDVFANKQRRVEPDFRSIDDSPGSQLTPAQLSLLKTPLAASSLPVNKRYVLLASSRDEEVSFEHAAGSTRHGAFTYFLCQELTRAEPGASFRDIFERTHDAVSSHYPTQHPQLEGVWDRALFSREIYTPKKYLLVTEQRDGLVTLNGGAAQGLTPGSVYGIYPPGARTDEKAEDKIGSVELTRVRAVTSDATLIGGPTDIGMTGGCRAFEEKHIYGEMRTLLSVRVPDEFDRQRRDIVRLIEASDLLRLADNGEASAVRIYMIPPRKEAGPDDPLPQIPVIDRPTWAAIGVEGEPVAGLCGIEEAPRLIANLETQTKYHNALDLRNPSADSPLAGKVTLTLKRWSPGSGWERVYAGEGSLPTFTVGDRIAFEIENSNTAPIFFYVLDFGLSGAISQLYPPQGANELLAAGNSICVGEKRGQEIELYLPESFPFVRYDGLQPASEGTETFKVFVTTREADFSALFQTGHRAAGGHQSPLEQLLRLGLTGRGYRDARPVQAPLDEEWTTAQRSFTLRAR